MFQKFTQLNAHDQGTGIGLALCRQIVSLMGGTIFLDLTYSSGSEFGPGSRFVAELPLPAAVGISSVHERADDIAKSYPIRIRGRYRALIVDNVPQQRAEIRRALEEISDGWCIDEAPKSEEALRMADEVRYDLIAIDQRTAEAGGSTASADLMAALRKGGVGIIAGLVHEEESALPVLQAGADIMWTRPLSVNTIKAQPLQALLPLPSCWRILIVEDSPVIRRVLGRTLHSALAVCTIVEASNSRDARAALYESDSKRPEPFDLVILDQHLGDDNVLGTELAREARQAGVTAVIAGFSGESMQEEHHAAGCDLSWPKTIHGDTIRGDLLDCLRAGLANVSVTLSSSLGPHVDASNIVST
jgi:CheY-like chemotaxis protein